MPPQDLRFSKPLKDYREIKDNDPYASIFGERESVSRERTTAWQKQFEKENEGVELPYERNSWLKRMMPNRYVRWAVRIKDHGPTRVWPVFLLMFSSVGGVMLWRTQWYKPKEYYREVNEVR